MLDRLLNQVNILEKGMDAVWLNNEVIAGNIANADTTNYKAKSVDFESVFKDALGSGSLSASGQKTQSAFQTFLQDSSTTSGSGNPMSASAASLAALDSQTSSISNNSLSTTRLDGNNVDVDVEMTELAKNSVLYETLTYSVSKELGRIKMVINEGK